MSNIIVLPMIVPIITAIFLVFLRDYIKLQRIISFITMLFVVSITAVMLFIVQTEGIMKLDFSGCPNLLCFDAGGFDIFSLCACNVGC